MLYVHAQDTTLISVHVHALIHVDSTHVLTDLQKNKIARMAPLCWKYIHISKH